MEELGTIIKRQRAKLNMTVSDLSKKSKISRRSIAEIENGITKKPKLETLVAIADVLDLNIDVLIDIVDYSDEELDFYFDTLGEHRLEYNIVISGTMIVCGDNEEQVIKRCARELATALESVDNVHPKFEKLKDGSEIDMYIKYLNKLK